MRSVLLRNAGPQPHPTHRARICVQTRSPAASVCVEFREALGETHANLRSLSDVLSAPGGVMVRSEKAVISSGGD